MKRWFSRLALLPEAGPFESALFVLVVMVLFVGIYLVELVDFIAGAVDTIERRFLHSSGPGKGTGR